MSKIDINLQNPFDRIFIQSGEPLFPSFHRNGVTPNAITYTSFIPAFLMIVFIYQKKFKYAAVMLLAQYILDCWDGHYARMYNMCSDTGDKLDHYKDFIISGVLIVGLAYYWKYPWYILGLYLISIAGFILHFSCMDKYYEFDKKDHDTRATGFLDFVCYPEKKEDVVKVLDNAKYFGNGTYIVLTCVLLWRM